MMYYHKFIYNFHFEPLKGGDEFLRFERPHSKESNTNALENSWVLGSLQVDQPLKPG